MAGYFNKTRGPITVSLKTGEPAMVPPKGTLNVTEAQDGSASLHAMVRRGLLVRLKTPSQADTNTTQPVAPSEPVTLSAPPALAASPEPPELPSKQWSKVRLIEHAAAMGLEIETSWTKVEILEAIEEAGR